MTQFAFLKNINVHGPIVHNLSMHVIPIVMFFLLQPFIKLITS